MDEACFDGEFVFVVWLLAAVEGGQFKQNEFRRRLSPWAWAAFAAAYNSSNEWKSVDEDVYRRLKVGLQNG